MFRRFAPAVALLAALAGPPAADAIPDPTLEWKTISTENFDVHFHEGAEWTGQQVARIAEEIRPYINGVYDYDPGRCHFVIMDTEDYANGAAYYYDNKIEIWATNLEFGLRGTTEWLRNVVTHEYTHVVSIQAGMKLPRRIPAIYLQWIHFEDEKRPDVITGYPNAIASYPLVGAVAPPWWAEGVAQYQSPEFQTDCWDTHREMILRAAVTDGNMLDPVEMGYLGHQSLGNEQVYDHGYGMVRYIADTYGPDAIPKITDALGKVSRLSMDGALEEVTGKDLGALYKDWEAWLAQRYDRQLLRVRTNPREGTVFKDGGFMVIEPTWSPDGSRMAYLSNKGSDFAITSLYLADADGRNARPIGPASSRGVFSADGKRLLYARHVQVNKFGARVSDLYEYDIEKEKDRRITKGARASEPQYAPDGKSAICVLNSDGTNRLASVALTGEEDQAPEVVFEMGSGTQMYAPQYAADGSSILFGIFTSGTRDIALIDPDGSNFRYVIRTTNDERDARWDGDDILFASDRAGIFNIYRLDATTDEVTQLTNVVGGAFAPDASPDGTVAYSGYGSKGYFVAVLGAGVQAVAQLAPAQYASRSMDDLDECDLLKTTGTKVRVGSWSQGVDVGRASTARDTGFAVAGLGTSGAPVVPTTRATLAGGSAQAPSATQVPDQGQEPDPAEAGSTTDPGAEAVADLDVDPYKRAYTDFQFYPRVVMWDGVLRFGAFMASREMLDRQDFFASGSYGLDGGFDVILSFQMRKLWPVLFLDYYRFRQKYEDQTDIDGLQYFLDLRYDVWAIEPGLRFEFTDPYSLITNHQLRLWYSRSEYRVHIDPTYEDTDGTIRPDQEVGWKYFEGNEFYLLWNFRHVNPALDSDINPRGGRDVRVELMYAHDYLFTSGEFEYGLRPSFGLYNFGRYTLDWREFVALPFGRHTLILRGMTSYIDNAVDDFFWVYLGGLDFNRGYTYYTQGGRAGMLGSATWRFPIWRRINEQLSWLTFKDLYGAVFFEGANTWNESGYQFNGFLRTAGGELRLNMGSWYAYPTTLAFMGAYGMDRSVFVNPLFPENSVVNEPRWRYYFLMGFTF